MAIYSAWNRSFGMKPEDGSQEDWLLSASFKGKDFAISGLTFEQAQQIMSLLTNMESEIIKHTKNSVIGDLQDRLDNLKEK